MVSLSYLFLFGSAEAVNMKALSYYGEIASGNICRGQSISQNKVREYLESIDIAKEDVSPHVHHYHHDEATVRQFFKDESEEVQEDTIKNFLSYYEKATAEEQYGLDLLITKIIESLQ